MDGNIVFIILSIIVNRSRSQSLHFPDSNDFVPAFIEKGGYIFERHYVTTKDGCILEIHRTWHPKHRLGGSYATRPVVFLMHGLFGSSRNFMHLGPKYAIAYNLAIAGLDVWMGNARGASPSRHHVSLNPKVPIDRFKYFDYSFDDISMYDLPAMIDYMLTYTNTSSLHYIAYSHASYYLFMLLSMKPDYIKRIKTAQLLGCSLSVRNLSPLVEHAIEYLKGLYQKGIERKIYELYANDFNNTNIELMCKPKKIFDCVRALRYIVNELAPAQFRTESASTKLLTHYGRIAERREFVSWDYGALGNLDFYGALDANTYNFSNIDIPTTIYYSEKDIFTNRQDALATKHFIPKTKIMRISDLVFNYADYFVNPKVKIYVTKHLLNTILSFEEENEVNREEKEKLKSI